MEQRDDVVMAVPRRLQLRLALFGLAPPHSSAGGARLTVETAPGRGTTVFLEVPLDPSALKEREHASRAPALG